MYRKHHDYLFAENGDDCLARLEQEAFAKIRQEPDDAILDCDPEFVVSTLMVNLHAEPVVLDEEGATRDEPEEITVTDNDYGIERQITGLLHKVRYPFTGYAPLLYRCPSE